MVGVNGFLQRIGTFAIFATLFVAIHGDKVKETFELEKDNVILDCENLINSWDINESTKTKYLVLKPEKEGCLKTKYAVSLNSSTAVGLKYFYENVDGKGKVIVTLIPVEGTCKDEECMWDVANDAEFKKGEWATLEHKFPLKNLKEYFISLHVDKNKGEFMVENIKAPGPVSKYVLLDEINFPDHLIGAVENKTKSLAPGLAELSKNLMITSASVLTLNHLLN